MFKYKVATYILLAVAATLASTAIHSVVNATYAGIMNCEKGCPVVAGGWSLAYLIDYPGLSPVGSVSLSDGVLGIDVIQPIPLAATFVSWIALLGAAWWIYSHISSGIARHCRLLKGDHAA